MRPVWTRCVLHVPTRVPDISHDKNVDFLYVNVYLFGIDSGALVPARVTLVAVAILTAAAHCVAFFFCRWIDILCLSFLLWSTRCGARLVYECLQRIETGHLLRQPFPGAELVRRSLTLSLGFFVVSQPPWRQSVIKTFDEESRGEKGTQQTIVLFVYYHKATGDVINSS